MSNVENIGLLDPAFFVGKNVLIAWVNDFLQVGIKKVEEMATGAYYCQFLDALYPGKVPLHRVNFSAKYEHEFVKNFNILQSVFTGQGINKYVDVARLVKARFQDNIEFLQWMKHFFEKTYGGSQYNPTERRDQAKQGYSKMFSQGGGEIGGGSKDMKFTPKPKPAEPTHKQQPKKPVPAPKPAHDAKKPTIKQAEDRSAEIAELNDKLNKLRETIEGLEKERNFYFGKLRQIEVLCQQDETKDIETKAAVLKILYQTDTEEAGAEAAATETVTAETEVTTEVQTEVQAEVQAEATEELPANNDETF